MILIIDTTSQPLSYFEFVKPIEDIVRSLSLNYKVVSLFDLDKKDLENVDKVIICGTALKDHKYLSFVARVSFLKDFKKPLLGICAGAQIISLLFGGSLEKDFEVGLVKKNFEKEFLGLIGEEEVYELHNYVPDFPENFEKVAKGVAIFKNFFLSSFHPEVRKKEVIRKFLSL